jgi:hypothetical protein
MLLAAASDAAEAEGTHKAQGLEPGRGGCRSTGSDITRTTSSSAVSCQHSAHSLLLPAVCSC